MKIPGCEVHVSVDPDDSVVLRVVGEIDLATVSVLEAALASLGSTGAHRVVLDASALSFIGAAGVRVAVAARDRLEQGGGNLVLREPRPSFLRVLRATGLADEFPIEPAKAHDGTSTGGRRSGSDR